jgi:hypothetical protein
MQKLREIIKILPSKVRDVLYVNSDKYRAVLGDVVKIVEVPVYMDENNNIVNVKKIKGTIITNNKLINKSPNGLKILALSLNISPITVPIIIEPINIKDDL